MKTIFYEVVINLADLEEFYSLFLLLIWSQKKILNSLLSGNLRGSQKFMTYLGTPKTLFTVLANNFSLQSTNKLINRIFLY